MRSLAHIARWGTIRQQVSEWLVRKTATTFGEYDRASIVLPIRKSKILRKTADATLEGPSYNSDWQPFRRNNLCGTFDRDKALKGCPESVDGKAGQDRRA
jgi:hypothetical protein